jgi:hypothetical protein
MLADARKWRFYQPDTLLADFVYWAKMAEWTESEAAALFCGLNPDYIAKLDPDYVGSAMNRLDLRSDANRLQAVYSGFLKLADRQTPVSLVGRIRRQSGSPGRRNMANQIPPQVEAEIVRWGDVRARKSEPEACAGTAVPTKYIPSDEEVVEAIQMERSRMDVKTSKGEVVERVLAQFGCARHVRTASRDLICR